MTKREIALHLALLMLLVLAGSGFYAYQKSRAVVPLLIRHLDSDSLRERQAATFRLQELGNAARRRDEFVRLNPTCGSARLTIYPTVDPHSRSYG